jgi:hypothetical protein
MQSPFSIYHILEQYPIHGGLDPPAIDNNHPSKLTQIETVGVPVRKSFPLAHDALKMQHGSLGPEMVEAPNVTSSKDRLDPARTSRQENTMG